MKQLTPVILLLMLFTSAAFAQNLVLNSDLESYSLCPQEASNLTVDNCYLVGGTPDYFNTCFDNPYAIFPVDAPTNFAGYQQPYSGEGYIGFGAYIRFEEESNLREFVAQELSTPLVVGTTYYVSTMVSFANVSGTAVNKLGIKFIGESMLNGEDIDNAVITNSAAAFTNEIISDTSSWVMIKGEFVADAAHEYVCLGIFFDDELLDTMFFQDADISGVTDFGYYYFDDVCVSTDSSDCFPVIISNNNLEAADQITLYPNPANDKIYFDHVEAVAKIKLVDIVGRLVLEKQVCTEMDISNLSSGTYFVQFENRQGQLLDVRKLIKH